MTRLEALTRACAELGLRLESHYAVRISDGLVVETLARIPELGGASGMLILSQYAEIESYTQRIADLGYGFAVLGEPKDPDAFDLNGYKRMFRDWGWSGALGAKPNWM
jgi:hypothetical protein